jgi:uncharacterized repeat protein (TIGR03803 family)
MMRETLSPSFHIIESGSIRKACVLYSAALAIFGLIALASPSHGQPVFEVVTSFDRPFLGGRGPFGAVVQGLDGKFYGTTISGGTYDLGTVFSVDASGSLTTLHHFSGADGVNPSSTLIQAIDGLFYGTTVFGGAFDSGTIFRIDSTGILTTIHSFATNVHARSGLMQASNGTLYGTTLFGGGAGNGSIFTVDAAGTVTTIHAFTNISGGQFPWARLVQASDGKLYGTTLEGGTLDAGTIFTIDSNGALTTIHSFANSDGRFPYGRLIQASDGHLYGTTALGGALGGGTIFRINPAGGVTTLHSFGSAAEPRSGLVQSSGGSLYGTTVRGGAFGQGTIFSIDTAGTQTTIHSFAPNMAAPEFAELVLGTDGLLYGTTAQTESGGGAIFTLNAAGALTTIHEFPSGDGGAFPYPPLLEANGIFYGATANGGTSGVGTVYTIDAAGTVTTIHNFSFTDGANPFGGLIQTNDGTFYGTTAAGGNSGAGTIFAMDATGAVTTTHDFASIGAQFPQDRLVPASDGNFYGTTLFGGPSGYGMVFRADEAGSLTSIHAFDYANGGSPNALIEARDGNFYGTTRQGGTFGGGTIFRISAAGTFSTIYEFGGAPYGGYAPYAGLVEANDGALYGTTISGGAFGFGTIFKMDAAGTLTTVYSFALTDGRSTQAGLIQGNDGILYGTTAGGGTFGYGTIFGIGASGILTTLHNFAKSDGAHPTASLIPQGGPTGGGVVFRLSLPAANVSPTSLNFGNQTVGTASAPRSVTLTNSGTGSLLIGSITFTGTHPADFAQTNTCGASVAPGASCTISTTFTPTNTGPRSAVLSITDNAAGSPRTVSLTGSGKAGQVKLTPGNLVFPTQVLGTPSAPQSVEVRNTGTSAVNITSIVASGDFGHTTTCGTALAAGAKCQVDVRFTPIGSGARNGMLTVATSAGAHTATLSGTGTVLSLSPTALDFGNQNVNTPSAPRTVTLTNVSTNVALNLASIAITGSAAADFTQSNNCGTSVAPGASCSITVTFRPSAKASRTATLTVTHDGGGSPHTVVLTGRGK